MITVSYTYHIIMFDKIMVPYIQQIVQHTHFTEQAIPNILYSAQLYSFKI